MGLNGSLEDYSPAGALRVLSSTGRTGAVRFSGEAGCTVYLHEGELYFARDDHTDQALVTALVRPGRVSAEDWARAIEDADEASRVGEQLVQSGSIDPDRLASVTLSVAYDPLIRLFREGDGAFEFEAEAVHWIGPYRTFDVDTIVGEVRRRVREVDEMSPVVPSVDAWVSASRTLPGTDGEVTLRRDEWELIASLAGPRTVTELAGEMGRGRYSTARVVYRLARAGLVQVVPEALAPLPLVGTADPAAVDLTEGADLAAWDRGFKHTEATDRSGLEPCGQGGADPSQDDPPAEEVRWAPWPALEDLAMDDPAAVATVPGSGSIGALVEAAEVEPAEPAGAVGAAEADPAGPAPEPDRTSDAAWLEGLYAQFMHEPEPAGRKRKKEASRRGLRRPR